MARYDYNRNKNSDTNRESVLSKVSKSNSDMFLLDNLEVEQENNELSSFKRHSQKENIENKIRENRKQIIEDEIKESRLNNRRKYQKKSAENKSKELNKETIKQEVNKQKDTVNEYKVTGEYKKMSARNRRAERSRNSRFESNTELDLELKEKSVEVTKTEEKKSPVVETKAETVKTEPKKVEVTKTEEKQAPVVETKAETIKTEPKTEIVTNKETKKMADIVSIEDLKANLEKAKAELKQAKAEQKAQAIASYDTDKLALEDQFNKASDFVVSAFSKLAEQIKIVEVKGETKAESLTANLFGENKFSEVVTTVSKYVSGKMTVGVTLGATPATIAVGATKGIFTKIFK